MTHHTVGTQQASNIRAANWTWFFPDQ